MEGQRPTVLVVDDDPSLRLLCRVNLELEGYRVVEAPDVESARAALAGHGFDAILLDVHLGREDGLDLLPAIEDSSYALLTGSPGVQLPDGAPLIGKPFSIDALVRTVRQLVLRGRGDLG